LPTAFDLGATLQLTARIGKNMDGIFLNISRNLTELEKGEFMRRCGLVVLILAAITLFTNAISAQSRASAGFEKLKSLAGDWQGSDPDGNELKVSYQIVSGGFALVETLQNANEPSMITLYHLDGDKLMVTHYCSSGNQPRMIADAPAGDIKNLDFKFFDVSNLSNPSAGHMRSLAVTFQDQDHIKQVWTWRADGKDETTTFNLERKK
jgi:hypothetical protein